MGLLALAFSAAAQSSANAQEPRTHTGPFKTTLDYVVNFYPLWFTYFQSLQATHNRLVGPETVTPVYKIVVAINVDTLYASTFLNLEAEPVIITIPDTPVHYSILTLDPFGDIFPTDLKAGKPGTYALTGPEFTGRIPRRVKRIAIPLDVSVLIFRIDRSLNGKDVTNTADEFRRSITMQTLSDYKSGKPPAATLILPVEAFSISYKRIADEMIAVRPITFLKLLQEAVAAPNTPPLSAREQALSDRFNALFGDGSFDSETEALDFRAGARAAHQLIVDRYLTFRGRTNWIHFTNIGNWRRHVVDRAAITEFIQYGNGIKTAAYYHAFLDRRGRPLDGTDRRGYIFNIPKSKIPEADRFWSITAYTPDTVELVRNKARKYVVASYTKNLQHNADGSISIYLARELPKGAPEANWLPVPRGPFNIMLRVYGPEGSVADNTYVPPGIRKR